jgi:L-threonylcarbamoyladenylate synthase
VSARYTGFNVATDLIETDPHLPSAEAIDRAAAIIRRGGIVAIPTDTLYALVCDPLSLKAVGRIFDAKGRESNRSLPLLVDSVMAAEELAKEVSPQFLLLARRFWPGPLTIITDAASKVPLKVTGNTGRLALRQPDAAIPVALLEKLGQPLIATSANLSGKPTCTSGIEVFGVMDGKVDLVLDGGLCMGPGATTIDVTGEVWRVIKEGAITEGVISEFLES